MARLPILTLSWLLPVFGLAQGLPLLDSQQVLAQARTHIAVLASDSLAGRGYVRDGHRKAAIYLSQQFAELGLQPWGDRKLTAPEAYWQRFRFPLNLITEAQLSFGRKPLALGQTFLPSPTTGATLAVELPVVDLGSGTIDDYVRHRSRLAGAAVLIRLPDPSLPDSIRRQVQDAQFHADVARQIGVRAVLLSRPKLVHAFAPVSDSIPILEVLASAVPRKVRSATVQVSARLQVMTSQNVVGYRPPDIPGTDSLLVLGAHYDHLGAIGSATFYGASDNASGTALLLAIAHQLQSARLRYGLIFVAFGAEETGLNGSFAFVRMPLSGLDLNLVRQMLNFDIAGAGPEVMAVGAKDFPQLYQPLQALNQSLGRLPALQQRPNAPISDHWPFTQRGIPALFFYTLGGPGYYHDVFDRPESLPLTSFVNVSRLMASYVHAVAGAGNRP